MRSGSGEAPPGGVNVSGETGEGCFRALEGCKSEGAIRVYVKGKRFCIRLLMALNQTACACAGCPWYGCPVPVPVPK